MIKGSVSKRESFILTYIYKNLSLKILKFCYMELTLIKIVLNRDLVVVLLVLLFYYFILFIMRYKATWNIILNIILIDNMVLFM